MLSCRFLLFPNCSRQLESVHFGHLHIHQGQVETLSLENLERLPSVVSNGYNVAFIPQEVLSQALVYYVVLNHQNFQTHAILAQ